MYRSAATSRRPTQASCPVGQNTPAPGNGSPRPRYTLGISLAGAVSAGSYSAGVIDFLFEALDALEAAKNLNNDAELQQYKDPQDKYPIFDPCHDIKIGAMSGTSAGAMVTAIAAAVSGTKVARVLDKVKVFKDQDNDGSAPPPPVKTDKTGNPFYDAWVLGHQDPGKPFREYMDQLLEVHDLEEKDADGNSVVKSFLDATIVQKTIKEVIAEYSTQKEEHPARPYLEPDMPVYLCLANLRGVEYELKMGGNAGGSRSGHVMRMHADHMEFAINPTPPKLDAKSEMIQKARLGREGDGSAKPDPKKSNAVPLKSGKDGYHQLSWDRLGEAAQASGAFPAALPAVKLERPYSDYNGKVGPLNTVLQSDGQYVFPCVDGGSFNNEPFDLCRQKVCPDDNAVNKYSAVMLIDPFPDRKNDAKSVQPSLDIVSVLKSLLSSYTAQSRFKPEELRRAADKKDTSLYAILPVRYVGGRDDDGGGRRNDASGREHHEDCTLATGFFGAFGGFFFKECRHHDFLLGRHNCQQFLLKDLLLPRGEPLFDKWPEESKSQYLLGDKYLPVIPLLGKLAQESYAPLPPWPKVKFDGAKYRDKIQQRMSKVKDELLSTAGVGFPKKTLINWAYGYFAGPLIDNAIIKHVQADLATWQLEK